MEEKPHIRNVIAKNIKKYRKLNSLTQEELAEAADVSNTYIANIECGQTWISDKTLEKLAIALHVDIYLLFIPEENNNDVSDSLRKKHETIEYLKDRQSEIGKYVKNFFSETFDYILKSK